MIWGGLENKHGNFFAFCSIPTSQLSYHYGWPWLSRPPGSMSSSQSRMFILFLPTLVECLASISWSEIGCRVLFDHLAKKTLEPSTNVKKPNISSTIQYLNRSKALLKLSDAIRLNRIMKGNKGLYEIEIAILL